MNILEKICAPSRWKQYLLTGMLANGVLSFFLQAITFTATKSGLSPWVSLGFDVVGIVIGVIFFFLAFYSYRMQFDAARTCKMFWNRWWKDAALLYIAIFMLNILPTMVLQYVSFLNSIVAVIASTVLYIVLVIFLIRKLIAMICDLQVEQAFLKESYVIKRMCRKPIVILATIALGLWFYFGESIISFLFLIIAAYTKESFLIIGIDLILEAIGTTLVLGAYISYLTSFRRELYHAETPEEVKQTIINEKSIVTYLITAIAALTIITNEIYMMKEDLLTQADEIIVKLMEEAENEIKYMKTNSGLKIYMQVQNYLDAMDAYVNQDSETLQQYMETYSDNDFYKRIYYTLTDDITFAKNQLLLSRVDTRLCHDILRYYKEQAPETKEEKELIEDCMWICMSKGDFIDSTIKFDTESIRSKNVKELKKQYESTLAYTELMLVWSSAETQGKLDAKSIDKLLDMADENPDNAAYQLLAVMGGASYRDDDAYHYDRVIECAKRWDAMLEKTTSNTNTLVKEKLYLAKVAMAFSKYEEALEFIKEVPEEKNVELQDSVLMCMEKLKMDEEVIDYVNKLRRNGEDRNILDYMTAKSYLRKEQITEALEAAVRLEEKVTKDENTREESNALLYSFAEYLSVSENVWSIDYNYRVYEYSEEQEAILKRTPILKNYITALNAIYNSGDKEQALLAIEETERKVPGLSLNWYVKGMLLSGLEEYDKAIEAFEKSISIDGENTTAMYNLAVLYDMQEEYEAAYDLCAKIIDRMPDVNHEQDWYGVAYHAKVLYEKLQEHLGGAK